MTTFSRILCAVDLSPSSHEALKLATALAGDRASLAICHVVDHDRLAAELGKQADSERLLEELRASAELALEAWRAEAALHCPSAEAHWLAGTSVWHTIKTFAERLGADLIVVGEGARRGGMLGSVAERVLRHAPCSVLVVSGAAPPLARLLCAVDFSAPAHAAMLAAADLAVDRGASLALVHALPDLSSGMIELARQAAEAKLRAWQAEAQERVHAPVEARFVAGRPAEEIVEVARHGNHDLVMAGSHGNAGLSRAILGSVAERIVRLAHRSVLVVKKE